MSRLFDAAAVAAVFLFAACDRPFVPVREPGIELLEPDSNLVQTRDRITVRLYATSFRGVSRVELGGSEMRSLGDGLYEGEVDLAPGLNRVVTTAWDSESVPGVDTLRFLRRSLVRTAGPVIPEAMGSWTATLLADGSVLFAGGAPQDTALATDRLLVFDPETGASREVGRLKTPRAGHVTTLLPDGSLLVTGGSIRGRPRGVHELVETVERIDPSNFRSIVLPVVGEPIRQTAHTADLRTTSAGLLVDILGGWGETESRPASNFGVRRDLRSFAIENDALRARHPSPGPFLESLAGHTQTSLQVREPGQGGRSLVTGWTSDGRELESFTLILDSAHPLGIDAREIAPPGEPRNEHAAVRDRDGLVWLLGGRTPDPAHPLSIEGVVEPGCVVYVPAFHRFLDISNGETDSWESRVRATATFLPDGRILMAGGFNERGTAVTSFEYLAIE